MSTSTTPPREEIRRAQIIGVGELHQLLGVESSTVHVWGTRKQRPEPDYVTINGHPAWRRRTIIEWAARTGRITDQRAPWLLAEAAPYLPPGGYRRPRRTKAEMMEARARAAEAELERISA